MKIIIPLLVLLLAAVFYGLCKRKKMDTPHLTKPTSAAEKVIADDLLEKLVNGDYVKKLDSLKTHVNGRKVINAIVGNAGFILKFDNDTWASAFRIDSTIFSEFGNGRISEKNLDKINSIKLGDATDSIIEDSPYGKDRNDITAEVKKSYGKIIEGLAIGNNTFNFAFENGMELDFQMCNDKNNVPSIRVFWEQW